MAIAGGDPVRRPQAAAPYPPARRAWATLSILVVASVLSVLDRNILSLFVDDVRGDLHISDVQVSLLQGLSFSLIYSIGGLMLGVLADRIVRKWLLFFGMVCWSAAVGLGGLATGFNALFASRLLVGLGEATLAPVAVSMISDLFPAVKRGQALSVYMMGQAIAPGLSIFLLGHLSQSARDGGLVILGAPWRTAFAFCGLLGLGAAGLVASMHEPVRRSVAPSSGSAPRVGASLGYLRRNAGFFAPFFTAFALSTVGAYALGAWSPTVLVRLYGMPAGQIGQLLGGVSIAAGLCGGAAAAVVSKATHAGGPGPKLKALIVTSLILILAGFAPTAPNAVLAILLFSLMSAGFPVLGTLSMATAQEAVPGDMRGLTTALFTLVSVVGGTLGPLLVAFATEHVFHRPSAVGYALLWVFVPAYLLSAVFYGVARSGQRRLTRHGGELDDVVRRQV